MQESSPRTKLSRYLVELTLSAFNISIPLPAKPSGEAESHEPVDELADGDIRELSEEVPRPTTAANTAKPAKASLPIPTTFHTPLQRLPAIDLRNPDPMQLRVFLDAISLGGAQPQERLKTASDRARALIAHPKTRFDPDLLIRIAALHGLDCSLREAAGEKAARQATDFVSAIKVMRAMEGVVDQLPEKVMRIIRARVRTLSEREVPANDHAAETLGRRLDPVSPKQSAPSQMTSQRTRNGTHGR